MTHNVLDREKSLELINLELTHKMKNFLMVVKTGLTHLGEYLPELIAAHQIAKSHQLVANNIDTKHLQILQSVMTNTKFKTKHLNFLLDVFSFMVQEEQWIPSSIEAVSIKSVWHSAIDHCPLFDEQQKTKINYSLFDDFIVKLDPILLEKIFLLLLHDIHQRITDDRSWQLLVETKKHNDAIYLTLKDSGTVLSAEALLALFDRVYTINQESYLGYFSCKKTMQNMAGEISCFITNQKETVFQLQFPLINIQ